VLESFITQIKGELNLRGLHGAEKSRGKDSSNQAWFLKRFLRFLRYVFAQEFHA